MAQWKNTPRILLKYRPQHFNYNYSSGYKTFIAHRILEDRYHPLYELRKRIHYEREKSGLWWHATVGPISKSRVVRNWARRRLQNAFLESLRERGITKNGAIMKDAKINRLQRTPIIQELLDKEAGVSLQGSIKLHALPTSISAKNEAIRKETGTVIDLLLEGLEADLKDSLQRNQKWQARSNQSFRGESHTQRIARPAANTANRENSAAITYARAHG